MTPVKITDVVVANAVVRCVADGDIRDGELHPGSFIEMSPKIVTEFGLPIRYVDAVRRFPDRPPWWISGHQLHAQPPTVARRLLDQLIDAEPEPGFLHQGGADWRGFTAFLLASTINSASMGGAHS